jgi:RND family efflux transporter MFP subunit
MDCRAVPTGLRTAAPWACALLAALWLGGCKDQPAASGGRAALVRTEIVRLQERHADLTLTGEVRARYRADLAFRVTGRVIARLADVGSHVAAGEVLARLDPTEQQADVDAATASVAAAESQVRVARTTFERQQALISQGFTTRVAFDQAQEALRSAESALESAKAQLGTAKDTLGYTELRAGAAGVITARSVEAGQVVQAAQPVFTLAQDGDRDAVFDVNESIFFHDPDGDTISLALVSDRGVTATSHVREVSPAVDPKSATVRVKLAIENPPAAMALGSAVTGTAGFTFAKQIILPWTALMALGSRPAVWVVDPATNTVALRPITIESHERGAVVVKGGLAPGDRVVIDGGKLLSTGEQVTYDEAKQ